MWEINEDTYQPEHQHHKETIFTIGNGYLSTRGAFEESYPVDRRATLIHGAFDVIPIAFTGLADAPDWLPLLIYLEREQFSLESGALQSCRRMLGMQTGLRRHTVGKWEIHPCLPSHWNRLTFHFGWYGEVQAFDIRNP